MMTRDDPSKPSVDRRSRPSDIAGAASRSAICSAGGREAILEHDGQDYRLRITANGKLILTK